MFPITFVLKSGKGLIWTFKIFVICKDGEKPEYPESKEIYDDGGLKYSEVTLNSTGTMVITFAEEINTPFKSISEIERVFKSSITLKLIAATDL